MENIINGDYAMNSLLKLDFSEMIKEFELQDCQFSYKTNNGLLKDRLILNDREFYLVINYEQSGKYMVQITNANLFTAKVIYGYINGKDISNSQISINLNTNYNSYSQFRSIGIDSNLTVEYFKLESIDNFLNSNLYKNYLSKFNISITNNLYPKAVYSSSEISSNKTSVPMVNKINHSTMDNDDKINSIFNALRNKKDNNSNIKQYNSNPFLQITSKLTKLK